MEELYYRIEEAAFTLRDYANRLSFDPAPHGGARRAAGASGPPEAEIRRHPRCGHRETGRGGRGAAEHRLGRRGDRELVAAIADRKGADDARRQQLLSGRRHEVAAALRETIEAEIRTLRMENARFEVVFREPPEGDAPSPRKGMDDLEFYLSANVGRGAQAAPGDRLRRGALPDHAGR